MSDKNRSVAFTLLGASNHTDKNRQEEDFYATHPVAMEKLLEREQFSSTVWEPAVGQGHLAEVLKNSGYEVICSDIVDRGYCNTKVQDFLRTTVRPAKERVDIITNPPYKYAQEFVQHSLDISLPETKIAMFLKIQFLEGGGSVQVIYGKPTKVRVCL